MNKSALVLFGWLLPGGAYLLRRRYAQFLTALALVTTALAAGIGLRGGLLFPHSAELHGTDTVTTLTAWGGWAARILAGGPYLLASPFNASLTWLSGRTHEFGTVLLEVAGLINLLAVADAVATESR